MKVNEYQQKDIHEDRIDFYYRIKTKEVNEILDFLMKHRQRLVGKANDKEIIFSLNDVYYFESVDYDYDSIFNRCCCDLNFLKDCVLFCKYTSKWI